MATLPDKSNARTPEPRLSRISRLRLLLRVPAPRAGRRWSCPPYRFSGHRRHRAVVYGRGAWPRRELRDGQPGLPVSPIGSGVTPAAVRSAPTPTCASSCSVRPAGIVGEVLAGGGGPPKTPPPHTLLRGGGGGG